jgi:hypothetical protein
MRQGSIDRAEKRGGASNATRVLRVDFRGAYCKGVAYLQPPAAWPGGELALF